MTVVLKFSFVSIICFCFLLFVDADKKDATNNTDATIDYFKQKSVEFKTSLIQLKIAINAIDEKNKNSIAYTKNALVSCREKYKQIEFFTEYFLPFSSNIYNRPTNVEVEEPNPEFIEPIGLQVMESLLFDYNAANKTALLQQVEMLVNSAEDLNGQLFTITINDRKISESLRLELVRIMALGIAGYDAPELKTSIKEAYVALQSIKTVLQPFLVSNHHPLNDSVIFYLDKSLQLLQQNSDFDSFDRLAFFTKAALPLQFYFNKKIKQLGLELNTTTTLNYDADHIFSNNFLNISGFPNGNDTVTNNLFQLGKKLFFDPILSGNGQRSCATCHQPDKYFTDGLVKNTSFTGNGFLLRNTPSLFYAAYQHRFFWDARSNNLEAQIHAVIMDKNEMNGEGSMVGKKLSKNNEYMELFKKAFPDSTITDTIFFGLIAKAIAAYEKSLAPSNSPFDKYIAGDKKQLSKQQVKGFNLFMGKAKCGTCHFAPLFNNLLPPTYQVSELENLGTPKNDNFKHPLSDTDSGHFVVMRERFNIKSFKTPTVRNAAATAPYMHNGAFRSLQKVVEFYNEGGGKGIGLPLGYQTLSQRPLKLNVEEIKAIISFINSLTDNIEYLNKQEP